MDRVFQVQEERANEENSFAVSKCEVPAISMYQRYCRDSIFRLLRDLKGGTLSIVLPTGEESRFGDSGAPVIRFFVHDNAFFARLAEGGSLALGESYMDGHWTIEEDKLAQFFTLIFKNNLSFVVQASPARRLLAKIRRAFTDPSIPRLARKNVEHHYDLSNDLFKLFLDESMIYSCGYAKNPTDPIGEMQEAKCARICAKLDLQRGGALLDIGCGWGGFLIYAATHFPNIHATGITVSPAQRDLARQRVREAGLEDRIKILLCDYRDISGQFDYIVSVGMFEHVGPARSTYMKACKQLLKTGGRGLLHTIGLEEDPRIPPDSWTAKYIFPGTRLPRLEEITSDMRRAQLQIGHIENLRPHYALTLRHWRETFSKNRKNIQSLNERFNDRFIKMWDYYLQISEACFVDNTTELYQILFSRRGEWAFPLTFTF